MDNKKLEIEIERIDKRIKELENEIKNSINDIVKYNIRLEIDRKKMERVVISDYLNNNLIKGRI